MPLDASKYLQKFGWSKGTGLGKDEDGIKSYIKVTQKDDQKGVGSHEHDFTKQFDDVFNNAAANVEIVVDKDQGAIFKESKVGKNREKTLKETTVYGGSFQKSNTLIESSVPTGEESSDSEYEDLGKQLGQGKSKLGRSHMYHDRCSGKLKRLQAFDNQFSVTSLKSLTPAAAAIANGTVIQPESTELEEKKKKKDKRKQAENVFQEEPPKKKNKKSLKSPQTPAQTSEEPKKKKKSKKKEGTSPKSKKASKKTKNGSTVPAAGCRRSPRLSGMTSQQDPPAVTSSVSEGEAKALRKQAKKQRQRAAQEAEAAAAAQEDRKRSKKKKKCQQDPPAITSSVSEAEAKALRKQAKKQRQRAAQEAVAAAAAQEDRKRSKKKKK